MGALLQCMGISIYVLPSLPSFSVDACKPQCPGWPLATQVWYPTATMTSCLITNIFLSALSKRLPFLRSWGAFFAHIQGGLRSAIFHNFSVIAFGVSTLCACWCPVPLPTAVANGKLQCFSAPDMIE